ncbi:MAG: hypothetical protein C4292_04180, partial [Nitrososphaera sp.]
MESYAQTEGKKIDFSFTPSAEPVFVDADRSRIFEVLSNLLVNAIKFTESGVIRVALAKDEKKCGCEHQGPWQGDRQDRVPKLFTKFSSKSERRMGLGLLIVVL